MSKRKSEVVMVLGCPSSGKTTFIQKHYSDHYHIMQMQPQKLSQHLEKALSNTGRNSKRIVVETNLATRELRAEIIVKAKQFGVPVVCRWLTTNQTEAMFNACWLFMEVFNRIVDIDDIKSEYNGHNASKTVSEFKSYFRSFEEPVYQEGFAEIDEMPFRRQTPFGKKKAVIFDYNTALRESSGLYPFPVTPSEVRILPNRSDKIINMQRKGYMLMGTSNESGIHKNLLKRGDAVNCFEKTNEMLGVDINWTMCHHREEPVSCFCRKPNVGMGVSLIKRYSLNPPDCIVVGDGEDDKKFAENCGFQFQEQKAFF